MKLMNKRIFAVLALLGMGAPLLGYNFVMGNFSKKDIVVRLVRRATIGGTRWAIIPAQTSVPFKFNDLQCVEEIKWSYLDTNKAYNGGWDLVDPKQKDIKKKDLQVVDSDKFENLGYLLYRAEIKMLPGSVFEQTVAAAGALSEGLDTLACGIIRETKSFMGITAAEKAANLGAGGKPNAGVTKSETLTMETEFINEVTAANGLFKLNNKADKAITMMQRKKQEWLKLINLGSYNEILALLEKGTKDDNNAAIVVLNKALGEGPGKDTSGSSEPIVKPEPDEPKSIFAKFAPADMAKFPKAEEAKKAGSDDEAIARGVLDITKSATQLQLVSAKNKANKDFAADSKALEIVLSAYNLLMALKTGKTQLESDVLVQEGSYFKESCSNGSCSSCKRSCVKEPCRKKSCPKRSCSSCVRSCSKGSCYNNSINTYADTTNADAKECGFGLGEITRAAGAIAGISICKDRVYQLVPKKEGNEVTGLEEMWAFTAIGE